MASNYPLWAAKYLSLSLSLSLALSIGFNPREVNVTEGSAAIITIIESTKLFPLNGGRRQTAQTMFNRAQLLFVQDTAVAG